MRKRNHVIPLHLNRRELEYLEAQVKLSGQPREEYLRTLIMGAQVRPKPCTAPVPVPTMRTCCIRWRASATMPTSWPRSQTLMVWQMQQALLK